MIPLDIKRCVHHILVGAGTRDDVAVLDTVIRMGSTTGDI